MVAKVRIEVATMIPFALRYRRVRGACGLSLAVRYLTANGFMNVSAPVSGRSADTADDFAVSYIFLPIQVVIDIDRSGTAIALKPTTNACSHFKEQRTDDSRHFRH
jgi:hypothetical protein